MDASERRRRAAAEAARWWVLLQDASCTAADRDQFVTWLRESAVHVAEMLRMARTHNGLQQFQDWSSIPSAWSTEAEVVPIDRARVQKPGADTAAPRSGRRAWLGALAASVLSALLIGAWYMAGSRDLTLETQRGERRQVSLEDGSTLDIDPQSRLRVRFERGRRLVFLDQGRALFHVAKNPQRPFIVDAARASARAVGTAFAVERGDRDGAVTVTVAEGRVMVAGDPVGATQAPAVLVAAGQQVVVSPQGEAGLVRAVNSDMVLAWARGALLFNGVPVAQVAREFNRYNRLQIHVTDPNLADRPITGSFNAGDPESFIAFLEVAGSAKTQRKGELEVFLVPPAGVDPVR